MDNADPTPIRNTPRGSDPQPTAVERRLLDRCVQIALGKLCGALKATLEIADEEFFRLAEKATDRAMEQLHLEAMALVRTRAEEIEKRFREHLEHGMQAALLPRKPDRRQSADADFDQFSLVDPDDLEESIATQEMVAKMRSACTEELGALEKRIGLLLHDPEFQRVKNPFEPSVLADAYMAACRDTEAPLKVRLLLVTMWDKHMQDAVLSTYLEINQYLVAKGILPRIRREIRRGAERTAEIAAIAAQAAVEAVQAAETDGDVFTALQHWFARAAQRGGLLGGTAPAGTSWMPPISAPAGTRAANPAAAASGTPEAVPDAAPETTAGALCNPGLLSQLTRLQHGQGTEQIPGLAQAATGIPVAILRDIREALPADSLNPTAAMTIEVVAMVFDFIFEDARVPDTLKALIGRLQIPVLKAAMIDPAFFSRRTHPTRRLLNLLGEAAIGWAGAHDDPLYRKIEEIVQRILDEFEDDLALFDKAVAELQAFLDEQERQADALVAAATSLIEARERQELAAIEAQEAAEDAVASRARDEALPEVVRNFLCETWTRVLARAHLEGGAQGEAWRDAMQTMDDLVWSTRPKASREDRERLIRLLPSLLTRLKTGMESVGVEQPVREGFMSQLVKCHAHAVSAGFAEGGTANTAAPRESGVVLHFPKREPRNEPVKLEILTPAQGEVEIEEITISGVGWADEDEMAAKAPSQADASPAPEIDEDVAREVVAALKPGMWVEFRHTGMEPLAAKLKWISPLRGAYLFCDRQGKRGATMPREKLEAAFRIGTARLLDEVPLSDRAVDNVIETLKQAAA